MSKHRNIWLIALVMSVLLPVLVAVAAQKSTAPPPSQHSGAIVAGQAAAKQLLLLMDTDKDGRVSKKEWMTFMDAEFDRLDTNHDGFVDVKDLEKSRIQQVPFYRSGK
jgi:hypothetical protein